MPIHSLVAGLMLHNMTRQSSAPHVVFAPGTWAIPKTGIYCGDVGVIVEDLYNMVDPAVECLLAFLPRLDLSKDEGRKKQKMMKDVDDTPSEIAVHTKVSTIKSIWAMKLVKTNAAAGYPIPVERTLKCKAANKHTRPPRISFGAASIPTFATHNNCLQKVTAHCVNCISPTNCSHWNKTYTFLQQTFHHGLMLRCEKFSNLQVANSIVDKDLLEFIKADKLLLKTSWVPYPASWSFQWGEQVIIAPRPCLGWGLTHEVLTDASTEGEAVILEVHESSCMLRYIQPSERIVGSEVNLEWEGHQRLVKNHFLVKVMNLGNDVQLLYGVGKAKSSELGFAIAENLLDEQISLVGQSGFIVGHNIDGTVQVQLLFLNNII